MMYIQCSKKLADAMKVSLGTIEQKQRNPFYEWHAHVYLFDRKKAVLLMNNQTRYPIVFYGLRLEHFKKFDVLVKEAIKDVFLAEGISLEQVETYLQSLGEVQYVSTDNRSILGQMKDFWVQLSWEIEYHLPSSKPYLVELSQWGANIPVHKMKNYPNQELKKWIQNI